ncbi:MAG: PglZ domain-containing protein [Sedimentibacter sp.]
MFFDYLNKLCGIGIYEKIIIFDFKSIIEDNYLSMISNKFKYNLIFYDDVENFRYLYETEVKKNHDKYIVLFRNDLYLPYDIRSNFYCKNINYREILPKLNIYALDNSNIFDMNLLYIAHLNLYKTINSELETKQFLSYDMFSYENINEYREFLFDEIEKLLEVDNYKAWCNIALLYSKSEYVKYRCNIEVKSELEYEIQNKFKEFILSNYSTLSGFSAYNGPVLLNKGLDYIFMNSKKPALIIMDGMSIFDWLIISEELKGITYNYNSTYAIIPTITSISRQSLLSGKLPVEMEKPFSLAYEKNMFVEKCMEHGYKKEEIKYNRGYDFEIDYSDKCVCAIINDIDDFVHNQKQGNAGMYNDIKLLSGSDKLQQLIRRLYKNGFDVYIASDHGHKETNCIGTPIGTGVELETKSKRTMILKDFADYEEVIDKFELIQLSPYFLPKDFKYLLCEHDKSFGIKGSTSVSHGGISIDEVIVPFIKIEGVEV